MDHLSRGLRPVAWPGLGAAAALTVNRIGEAATREGTRYRRRSRTSAGSPQPRVATHQSGLVGPRTPRAAWRRRDRYHLARSGSASLPNGS